MSISDVLETADGGDGPIWTLGDRMAKARKMKGWEQADVAAAIGVSRSLVSKWERDGSVPDALEIRAFVQAIDRPGVTFEWLTASPCFWPIDLDRDQMRLALEPQLVA